jgi:hypothetical protein
LVTKNLPASEGIMMMRRIVKKAELNKHGN